MADIILQTNDFSGWTNTGITQVPSQTGPDGESSATLLDVDGTGWDRISSPAVSFLNEYRGLVHNYSFFIKPSGTTWAFARITSIAALLLEVYLDLDTPALGTSGADVTTASIEPWGNDGWFYGYVVFTSDATDSSGLIQFSTAAADTVLDCTAGEDMLIAYFDWRVGATPFNRLASTGGNAGPGLTFGKMGKMGA